MPSSSSIARSSATKRNRVVVRAKGKNSRARSGQYNRTRTTIEGDDADDTASTIERLESNAFSTRSASYDKKKLAKVKAQRDADRAREAAKRDAFDAKYAQRSAQGIPQIVTDRMLKRVGIFCGTPLMLGFTTGPLFYYFKAVRHVDVPPWVFFTASTATFGAAFIGISYGVLSASWDPRREGTFWGGSEFKENVPVVISTIMNKAKGEKPLEWDDESDVDT